MKVISSISPVQFADGQAVAPEDVNRVFDYCADVVDDVSQKRFAICAVEFPFIDSVAAGVTNASTLQLRTWRFVCPVNCSVLRGFVVGNLTAASAVSIALTSVATSLPPTGGTVPYLSIPAGAVPAVEVDDINVQRCSLTAGTVYELVVSGTSFTTERCDVVLHIAVDRWHLTGSVDEPRFLPFRFVDTVADGDAVAANVSALDLEAAKFDARGMACVQVWARNFNNATAVADRTFLLPSYLASRANARIVAVYLSSAVAATGTTVTATVRNAAAATVATASNNHAALTIMTSANPVGASITINAGDPSLPAQDFSVEFSSNNATICNRAALLVWVRW